MIKNLLFVLLFTVVGLATDVVLFLGFGVESKAAAYISAGVIAVCVITRRGVAARTETQRHRAGSKGTGSAG
ncbi:hypothetical protein [Kitasatospora sp. NPDC001175]|uniref:hypothetical protein n=1 Tax=Kitasatospora sp. NPDC001175 TaxID=3157103 RepID=UPI003D07BC40